MKFIVLPVNIERCHWTLIVVAVHRHGTMMVHMYDPSTASYRIRMEKIWTNKLLPYLRAWHAQWECQGTRQEELPFPPNVDIEWLMPPEQPDGNSCGVMVAAMTYSFIYGGRGFTVDAVSRDVVKKKLDRSASSWPVLSQKEVRESGTKWNILVVTNTDGLEVGHLELGVVDAAAASGKFAVAELCQCVLERHKGTSRSWFCRPLRRERSAINAYCKSLWVLAARLR
ncbi:Ulp1 protease family, C-terminal catalytic domain [Phytophthora cactorum]|nr:Ulp1 protease family, C-terminal catalytic domain [Phytophthora cactorum]